MAEYVDKEVSLAFDIYGCPNRCRHCWLGHASATVMDRGKVYREFERIRKYVKHGLEKPHLDNVRYFAHDFREPDFSDDYQELHETELKYSNGVNFRREYELLSVWRLARDKEYAEWAKRTIGPEKCQVTLFGIGETNDWFYGRKGAYQDAIKATMKLLEVGIKPRWQLFQTKKILPELDQILKLIDKLDLRKGVAELGGEFELFMHDPGPTGEGIHLEPLRITVNDLKYIPEELVESTKKHFSQEELYYTESDLLEEIDSEDDRTIGITYSPVLWFFVKSSWDVFANVGSLEPWWRLGNLKLDTLTRIFSTFLENQTMGLNTVSTKSIKEIALLYGDRRSNRIYMSKKDLMDLYLERYCKDHFNPLRAKSQTQIDKF